MPVRQYLKSCRFSHLLLVACLLHMVVLEPLQASKQDGELLEQSAEKPEQIRIWQRMIDEHEDAVFIVTFITGDKHIGKLELAEGGLLIKRREFQTLTKGERIIDRVDWKRIRAVEYYGKTDQEDRIGKRILIGMLTITGIALFYYFITIGKS